MGQRGRPRHPDVLTPREQDVLSLIREGLTNEQIAARLGITFETAKHHVSEIISKLGVATREEAAATWAARTRQPVLPRIMAGVASIATLKVALIGTSAIALAAVAGLGVAVLLQSGDDDESLSPTPSSSPTPTASGAPTPTPSPVDVGYFPAGFQRFAYDAEAAIDEGDQSFLTDNVEFGQWDCGGSPPPAPGPNCVESTTSGGRGIVLGLWNSEGNVLSPPTYNDYIAALFSDVKTGSTDDFGDAAPRLTGWADLQDNIESDDPDQTFEFAVSYISSDPNAEVPPNLTLPGADPSRQVLVFYATLANDVWTIVRVDRASRSLIDPYLAHLLDDGGAEAVQVWLPITPVTIPTPSAAGPP